jgi:cell division protein FtsQ
MTRERRPAAPAPRPPVPRSNEALRAPPRPTQSRSSNIGLLRALTVLCALLILAAVGLGVGLAFDKASARKIERVNLEGALSFVTREEITAALAAEVATSLLAVDLASIKQVLEALPWIRKAEVRRQWPDTLHISLEEEIPIARWGAAQLLNQQGQVFQPATTLEQQALPQLSGPEHSELKVMNHYQEFNQLLYPLGVRIRDLTLKPNGSYELTLTNGIEVKVGREDVLERLRRLVLFLESEQGRDLQNVQAIDLRYRSGLAVAWRPVISGMTPEQDPPGSLVTR